MPPVARKSRPKRFEEFEERIAKDFDIENEAPEQDEESGSEDSADELAGTEHYVAVGKSKLRQKDEISLGPEYRGSRVSRAALEESSEEDEDEDEEEEFDDPETADLEADQVDDDAEISSDNALCSSDDENLKDFVFRGSSKPKVPNGRIKKRPTAADFMSSSGGEDEAEQEGESGDEEEEDDVSEEGSEAEDGARLLDLEADLSGEDDEDDEEEDDEEEDDAEDGFIDDDDEEMVDGEEDDDDEEDDEEEDEEDEDDDDEGAKADDGDDERAQLRKMATEGQKSIVAAMSQAAKADAEKGMAVRVQRRAFDSILNLRIRLQKALIAANSFGVVENRETGTEAYQAAEEAAVKLWNTIDSVRDKFMPESSRAKIGEKRKRDIDVDTPSQAIWESMQAVEEIAHSHRRKVLDKWSERVKKSNAALSTRKLVNSESQSLVSALDEQLLGSERLIKRARTPRSCAPAQAAKKVVEDPEIYDDADFYQLLLKELVDQRSTDTGAPGESVATVRWAALKETKTRKVVDRRASKGRKLRYTVHEKLQNFMAPEDRRSWEEHAIDRLFGTLFGQRMVLREEDVSDEDEEMGGVNVEEAGLKLFRS